MKRLLRHLVVLLAVAVASCGDDPAVATVDGPQFASSDAKLERLAQYQNGPLKLMLGLTAKWIGPDGGSIRLLGFEAVVPPGAVSKLTLFTIRVPLDLQNSQYVRAEFGPHGKRFAVPVTLRLPLRGTTAEGSSTRVLWWDGTQWVAYDSRLTEDGRIETLTNHFSEYGTEDPGIKGIILGGGN